MSFHVSPASPLFLTFCAHALNWSLTSFTSWAKPSTWRLLEGWSALALHLQTRWGEVRLTQAMIEKKKKPSLLNGDMLLQFWGCRDWLLKGHPAAATHYFLIQPRPDPCLRQSGVLVSNSIPGGWLEGDELRYQLVSAALNTVRILLSHHRSEFL